MLILLILLIIIGFPLGFIIGTVQFFRDRISREKPLKPCKTVENVTLTHYKQRFNDLLEVYKLAEKEFEKADTLSKKRSTKQRLITLDNQLFNLQQKINEME